MLIIWMIGLIMLAACREVWTFAAAQVFASIGYDRDVCICVVALTFIAQRELRIALAFLLRIRLAYETEVS